MISIYLCFAVRYMMAKLPSLDHFQLSDSANVYEPSDDTFLLCDALNNDRNELISLISNNNNNNNNEGGIILEIGTGSGCVLTYIAMMMKENNINNVKCIGIDININAVNMTMKTAENNNVNIDVKCCDFNDNYIQQYENKIDILIFNPPYVPTPDDELGSNGIEAAWAGGNNGRIVIDKFLPIVTKLLTLYGRFYLVVVEENKPKQIIKEMEKYNLNGEIILKRKAINEGLQIIRFTR